MPEATFFSDAGDIACTISWADEAITKVGFHSIPSTILREIHRKIGSEFVRRSAERDEELRKIHAAIVAKDVMDLTPDDWATIQFFLLKRGYA